MAKINRSYTLNISTGHHYVMHVTVDGKVLAEKDYFEPFPDSGAEERERFYNFCESLALDKNYQEYKDDLLGVRPYYDRKAGENGKKTQ